MDINAYPDEISMFDQLAAEWWDPEGKLGTLQVINPLRARFILESIPIQHPRVLDVGCGGGILAEALSKAGARVTGIDLSQQAIQVARAHAAESGLEIEYQAVPVKEFVARQPASFDAVTCLETLEHVPRPEEVIAACARALKPGGSGIFSSLNRTLKSFLFAILIGEYLIGLLPRGSHSYTKLLRPDEIKRWAEDQGLEHQRSASLIYNPLSRNFHLAPDREDINYLLHFVKPDN